MGRYIAHPVLRLFCISNVLQNTITMPTIIPTDSTINSGIAKFFFAIACADHMTLFCV